MLIDLIAYEMCHNIPWPLYNRTFATLVITAKPNHISQTSSNSYFIDIQLPLDLTSLRPTPSPRSTSTNPLSPPSPPSTDSPPAIYSTGANRKVGDTSQKRKKVVLGKYVSVERCKIEEDGRVTWEMGTASDAGGWLPMAIQKLALPGAVRKDVGWFIDWTAKRRNDGVKV
jgi:hypothetical protein